jgi:RimJ/RimL family protein N-acetyltransferase
MSTPTLATARLRLRPFCDDDRDAFARMNGDARVMAHFPSLLSPVESNALLARIRGHFDTHGFGLWAVEVPPVAACAGFIGLAVPSFAAAFTPCVEVGWRLAHEYWGHGYAIEGAHAACAYGFGELALTEIVSFTVPANVRSRRVMERLGMRDARDDFDHPRVPDGHPLKRHVLYRLRPHELRPLDTSRPPHWRP